MSQQDPFAPYAQGGKPGRPFGLSRYSAMQAYGDMARGPQMRPNRVALSAYDMPQRTQPMGYGYGMPRRAWRDPGSPSDPFSGSGGY